MDIEQFPALLLATEYHDSLCVVETTIDELKVHLNGRKTPIRSQNPREVVQFVYGWLLSHWAVRCLMFQVAQQAQISPLRLGFTGTLKVKRLSCAQVSEAPARGVPFFWTWLVLEILDEQIPEPEGRNNPRVIKKRVSKFPSKTRSSQRDWSQTRTAYSPTG